MADASRLVTRTRYFHYNKWRGVEAGAANQRIATLVRMVDNSMLSGCEYYCLLLMHTTFVARALYKTKDHGKSRARRRTGLREHLGSSPITILHTLRCTYGRVKNGNVRFALHGWGRRKSQDRFRSVHANEVT